MNKYDKEDTAEGENLIWGILLSVFTGIGILFSLFGIGYIIYALFFSN